MVRCDPDAVHDFTPFTCLAGSVPLGEMNPPASALLPAERHGATISEGLPLEEPDRADEDTLNRMLWHAVNGVDAAYPSAFAGAHGKGLRQLGLRLDPNAGLDDND